MSGACSTTFACRVCSGKHNTLLHLGDTTSKTDTEKPTEKSERATSTSCNAQFSGTTRTDTTVLLGTVMVRICDNTGVLRSVRAVLDSGSQVSAMTLDCVNRLGLTRSKCRMELTGLSQQLVATVKGQIQFSFFPTQSDLPEFKANNVIVLPNIMSITPNGILPPEVRERYRHLVLADPQFDRPAPVDMLIGGDLYPFVIQARADIIHTTGLPSAMSTNLGWVLIGTLEESTGTVLTSLSVNATPSIEEVMQRFWTVEEPNKSATPTTQDRQCEEWFAKTVTRDTTGRFYVGLPFRTVVCPPSISGIGCDEEVSVGLGSSRTLALHRLYNLERRIVKNPELYDAYRVFMDDYISLGYMRVAMSSGKYFIPHHPVVKQDHTGLKIRVVFDASAPSLTIPRLELCAALLLSSLMSQRLQILKDKINIARVRAWTDSTIVLAWLTAEQKSLKIFVTNRVAKIWNLLPQCEWAHVDTTENPADPASQRLLPDALVSCSLFLHGPTFLFYPESQWPIVAVSEVRPKQLPEYKGSVKCVLACQEDDNFIKRFSSLGRMQRVLAYCLRFADKVRRRPITTGPVSWWECKNVLAKLVKYTQNVYYPDILKQLTSSSVTVTPNTLAQLAPFVDQHGIIRVGGRLKYSALSSDAKYPMLLPKAAHLTDLIVQDYHYNTLHEGTRLILSLIQRRFWIVSGRAAVRRVLYRCIPCKKYKATTPQPKMADLPSTRVQAYRPFINVGMDYGGPFIVKESRRRNTKMHKAYLALFMCLSTKAVHLEVVSDLSTTAFLAALDRFIARRGIPTQIQSDCGTNYVEAARQLKGLFQEAEMQDILHSRVLCQWKFNPPAAPHFGGIWEAAIKSTKLHLTKVVGTQVYTLEELMTLVIRVEGVLNSRTLVPMSNDPNDLCALTPGHFLIEQPIMAIPEHDIREVPQNRLNRWQLLKQAFQSFWTRWSREYLHTLQSRQKWYVPDPNLNVGDMVINSPSQPPLAWQIGRVIAVHPGPNDIVRIATVKTTTGVLTRPVVKLVKLPTA